MAVQATAQWWVRTDGDNTNGGGYDSGISGAGTNYSDQASAQLSLTDLATASAGSTTLTSVTGGFTAAMIGNAIQIVSGTNSVPNSFYFITAYTDTNTVTLDRACDDGVGGLSGGSGKVGGAAANLEIYSGAVYSGGNANTPIVGGNQINIRGTGSYDSATPDYTHPQYWIGGWTFQAQHVTIVGYNGRPHYKTSSGQSLFLYNTQGVDIVNMKLTPNGTSNGVYGVVRNLQNSGTATLIDCIIDQEGYDIILAQNVSFQNCIIKNTGTKSAGSYASVLDIYPFGRYMENCLIDSLRGGIQVQSGASIRNCVISNLYSHGIKNGNSSHFYPKSISNNLIYGCTGDGIDATYSNTVDINIFNNVLVNNGGYGINANSSAYPTFKRVVDYNYFYNNNNGNYNNYSGGEHDVNLTADPFVDAANGDFNLNATNGGGGTLRSTNYTLGG